MIMLSVLTALVVTLVLVTPDSPVMASIVLTSMNVKVLINALPMLLVATILVVTLVVVTSDSLVMVTLVLILMSAAVHHATRTVHAPTQSVHFHVNVILDTQVMDSVALILMNVNRTMLAVLILTVPITQAYTLVPVKLVSMVMPMLAALILTNVQTLHAMLMELVTILSVLSLVLATLDTAEMDSNAQT